MAYGKMDFEKSPEENLRTWDKIWKMMLVSGAVSLVILGLLGLIFV